MGGIINYYHGESGLVVDRQFVLNEEQRALILRLQGDPHREFAFAYGGDVYIDPLLRKGDTAVFIRTEQYGGLWVREQDSLYPELQRRSAWTMEEFLSILSTASVSVLSTGGS